MVPLQKSFEGTCFGGIFAYEEASTVIKMVQFRKTPQEHCHCVIHLLLMEKKTNIILKRPSQRSSLTICWLHVAPLTLLWQYHRSSYKEEQIHQWSQCHWRRCQGKKMLQSNSDWPCQKKDQHQAWKSCEMKYVVDFHTYCMTQVFVIFCMLAWRLLLFSVVKVILKW